MGEGFGEAGVGEVVAQLGVQPVLVLRGPGGDFLGNLLERGEMAGGIAVPPYVVGDGGFAAAEEFGQMGAHGGRRNKHIRSGTASGIIGAGDQFRACGNVRVC